ncbi:MAG TPA: 3-isopropylmalate dehydratase small subunit [Chloroflexota bacterium]|nr:3-isopropylmalate dehydratase small subunit [Chloroflexota bacterium]
MRAFTREEGLAAPYDKPNVDTDEIIPAEYLKRIERTGFGQFLFFAKRFKADGSPNPDFVLNEPRYKGASILVAGPNFGCGSSREHAPWALEDYGFRAIIASSFADIFTNNCAQIGLLNVVLPEDRVKEILREVQGREGYSMQIDLENQTVTDPFGHVDHFDIDPFKKYCYLNGLDAIGLTLQHEDSIRQYEGQRQQRMSWLPAFGS